MPCDLNTTQLLHAHQSLGMHSKEPQMSKKMKKCKFLLNSHKEELYYIPWQNILKIFFTQFFIVAAQKSCLSPYCLYKKILASVAFFLTYLSLLIMPYFAGLINYWSIIFCLQQFHFLCNFNVAFPGCS